MEDSQRKIIGSVIGLIVFIMCIASLTFPIIVGEVLTKLLIWEYMTEALNMYIQIPIIY